MVSELEESIRFTKNLAYLMTANKVRAVSLAGSIQKSPELIGK